MTEGHQTEGLHDTVQGSATPEPQGTFRVGDVLLERFKLVRLVGRGGMGEVYEARDLRLHINIALKTVRASSAGNPELLDRLRREVQLARAVTHPNVCRLFDLHEGSGPDGPVAFVTMEFLDGQTLAERLEAGPLPPREAIPLLEQMAEGLAAIHAKGLVHRDFKPGNVMLVSDEGKPRAVVTDFGIARAARDSGAHGTGWMGTEEGAVIGSPAYMSPEQRQGSEVNSRSDIHALALVACEVVSGKLPSE
ncbi:MAG TPA: serine/threonine-protein kinase, partial [Myxococcaceae bacterium]|nr:serine/threonine-protein kinase [Myxococcaceae bacterium]